MGAAGAKPKVTRFSRMTQEVVNCGLSEFDKIFLLLDEAIEHGEKLRFNVLTTRECLMRISKVHLYKDAKLLDAFKVWLWATAACNDGDVSRVQFKAAWDDYNNIGKVAEKPKAPEPKDESLGGKLSSGFGAMMDFGKKAAEQVQKAAEEVVEKVQDFINGKEEEPAQEGVDPYPNMLYYEFGSCQDYKLQLWPQLVKYYLINLLAAKKRFQSHVQRIEYLYNKIKNMKDDRVRIQSLLDGTTFSQKAKIVVLIGANLAQSAFALEVAKQFLGWIPDLYKEADEFLQKYQEAYDQSADTATKVFKNIGVRPWYQNEYQRVLRRKLGEVASYLKLKVDKTLQEEEKAYKLDRKNRRPKRKEKMEWDDTNAPEDKFPTKFRWLDIKHFDGLFAGASVALAELETARVDGEKLRKKMFKMTGAGKFKNKNIVETTEVWTWGCAAGLGGKLAAVEMKLIDKEPYIEGKDLAKVKFAAYGSGKMETYKEELEKYLAIYSPSKFQRLQNYWADYCVRWTNVNSAAYQILEHGQANGLSAPDAYNAITSLGKNILCFEVFYYRSVPLYNEIIDVQGQQVQELYQRFPQFMIDADGMADKMKGVDFNKVAEKIAPGKLSDADERKNRKAEAKNRKAANKKRKWIW